jgi:F420-dependent oxidoreductase-like protein
MRFSMWPSLQQPWSEVTEVVHHAEATGWDGVYLADHFMGDAGDFGPVETPTLEAIAALAALAASTDQLRLGSLVFGTTYRHPAVMANWAATVDQLSGGRLVLGLGAGWQANEHEQYGIELPPRRQRVDRFAEVCAITRELLADPATTFAGEFFQLTDAIVEPKPVQRPLPILIGARGDRMLGVVARFADEWNMWSTPETLAERRAVLDRRCETIGRAPAEIVTSTQALVMITDDEDVAARVIAAAGGRPTIAGPAHRLAEVIGQWREVGVSEVIIPDFVLGRDARRLESMDEIIETVAPTFRDDLTRSTTERPPV